MHCRMQRLQKRIDFTMTSMKKGVPAQHNFTAEAIQEVVQKAINISGS